MRGVVWSLRIALSFVCILHDYIYIINISAVCCRNRRLRFRGSHRKALHWCSVRGTVRSRHIPSPEVADFPSDNYIANIICFCFNSKAIRLLQTTSITGGETPHTRSVAPMRLHLALGLHPHQRDRRRHHHPMTSCQLILVWSRQVIVLVLQHRQFGRQWIVWSRQPQTLKHPPSQKKRGKRIHLQKIRRAHLAVHLTGPRLVRQ